MTDNLSIVSQLGELLALCGISSIRCFLPTFLVCLLCRFAPSIGVLSQLTQQIPDAMLANGGLVVLGVLAGLELLANWDDTIRDVFSDVNWERYAKPLCTFAFALAVGSPEISGSVVAGVGEVASEISVTGLTNTVAQAAVVTNSAEVVAVTNAIASTASSLAPAGGTGFPLGAWTWSVVVAGLSAFGTSLLCGFRRQVADLIRTLDPDNGFKLQSFASAVDETTWLALLLVALLVPTLAILLMAVAGICGYAVKCILRACEQANRHDCPQCSARVHDSAVRCPRCGVEQPLPYHAVGFRGLPVHATVDAHDADSVRRHHAALLREHRCPVCAEPLDDKFVCVHCGTRVWEQGVSREDVVQSLDRCLCFGAVGGILGSAIPVFGFVLAVVFLNLCVLRIVRAYETKKARFLSRLVFRFAKWTALIVCIAFSSLPFAGALFLLPYVCSYWRSRGRFLR